MNFNKFKQFKPLISRETHHFKYKKSIAFALCCVEMEISVVKTLDLTTVAWVGWSAKYWCTLETSWFLVIAYLVISNNDQFSPFHLIPQLLRRNVFRSCQDTDMSTTDLDLRITTRDVPPNHDIICSIHLENL